MERLTSNNDYCRLGCDLLGNGVCPFGDKSKCYEKSIHDKLREYERAEEQGLLIRLPCKVGDRVYLINHSICETRKKPLQCVIDEFTFDRDNRCYAVLNGDMSIYMMRRFKAVNVDKFGLTVFTSKAEAEQALAEKKGGSNEV